MGHSVMYGALSVQLYYRAHFTSRLIRRSCILSCCVVLTNTPLITDIKNKLRWNECARFAAECAREEEEGEEILLNT